MKKYKLPRFLFGFATLGRAFARIHPFSFRFCQHRAGLPRGFVHVRRAKNIRDASAFERFGINSKNKIVPKKPVSSFLYVLSLSHIGMFVKCFLLKVMKYQMIMNRKQRTIIEIRRKSDIRLMPLKHCAVKRRHKTHVLFDGMKTSILYGCLISKFTRFIFISIRFFLRKTDVFRFRMSKLR